MKLPGLRSLAWVLVKQWIRLKFPDVQTISPEQLDTWLNSADRPPPQVIDARKPEEYRVSHLPNAQQASLVQPPWQDISPDTPIVVYCSVGYRSARLAQRLQAMGHSQVFNLEGSIFEWVNEGRSVYQNGQTVEQVHPYNATWGQLLKSRARGNG
ncbi:MAG: rhodanese-like domain-containing protein [Elainellaceae cyanobacterium]